MSPLLPFLAALPLLAAGPASIDAMRWHRRVLIVAAPTASDSALAQQRRALGVWRDEAIERDISLVEVIGDRVTGATDHAPDLRRRFHLPAAAFTAVLIGKDGQVAMREAKPIATATLQATIDAMPMRRAGGR